MRIWIFKMFSNAVHGVAFTCENNFYNFLFRNFAEGGFPERVERNVSKGERVIWAASNTHAAGDAEFGVDLGLEFGACAIGTGNHFDGKVGAVTFTKGTAVTIG